MKTKSLFAVISFLIFSFLLGNITLSQPYKYNKDQNLYYEKDNPNKRYSGEYKVYFGGKKLKREEHFKNGHLIKKIQYFRNGIISYSYTSTDTTKHQYDSKIYDRKGNIYRTDQYVFDTTHGYTSFYHKNGQVFSNIKYEYGNPIWEKHYREDGSLEKELYFLNSEIEYGWQYYLDTTIIGVWDKKNEFFKKKKRSEVDFSKKQQCEN